MRRIGLLSLALLALVLPTSLHATSLPPAPSRDIYLEGEVTQEKALGVEQALQYFELASPKTPITLHITSEGGSVVAGLIIIDTMRSITSPVTTVCEGYCYSMGAYILAEGDMRVAMPSADIMIHQIKGGAEGGIEDMSAQLEQMALLQDKMFKLFAEKTGMSMEKVLKETSWNHFMGPEEALKLGIIDVVFEPVKKE